MSAARGKAVSIAGAVLVVVVGTGIAAGQKAAPAEVAARLSGTWKVNRELSPSLAAPGRGRAGGGQAVPGGARFVAAPAAMQRGGRGGGGGGATEQDLTPEERALQAAMRQLQQVPELVTIAATPEAVDFTDAQGSQVFATDNKNLRLEIAGARVNVKTRWDRATLRQEFSTPLRKLIRVWEVDGNDRLVLKARIESITLNSADAIAVYERQ